MHGHPAQLGMPAGQVPFGYLPPNGYPPQLGQVPIGPYGYPPLGPYGLPPQMLALGPPLGVYPCGYEPARRDRSRSRSANRRKGKADAHAERARSVLTTTMQKTKMCDFHKDGRCKYGKGCAFAHEEEELKIMPDLRKTRICRSFSQGSCSNANCKYAHGNEELRSTDMCYKTAMCTWFEKGNCQSGDQCRFAHGVEELRKEDEDNDAAASSAAVPSADGVAAAPAAGDSPGGNPAAPEGTVAPESKKNTRRQRQRQKRKADKGGKKEGDNAGEVSPADFEEDAGSKSDAEDEPAAKRAKTEPERKQPAAAPLPNCPRCGTTIATHLGITTCVLCKV